MRTRDPFVKKAMACVIALLLVGGMVFVVVGKRERDPLQVSVTGELQTKDGWPVVTVRIDNRSTHNFQVFASSAKRVGTEWLPLIADSRELMPFPSMEIDRGSTWDVKLPRPKEKVQWQIRVKGQRRLSDLEKDRGRVPPLVKPFRADAGVEKILEFNE